MPGSFTTLPSIRISPEVAGCKPAIKWSRVDLPQPEGPTMQRNSPGLTFRLMSSKASRRVLALVW